MYELTQGHGHSGQIVCSGADPGHSDGRRAHRHPLLRKVFEDEFAGSSHAGCPEGAGRPELSPGTTIR